MIIALYNLANLCYLTKEEKCYQHLILSLSLYGNSLISVKRKRMRGKYFISCTFWSESKQVQNSLDYYLKGEQIEKFIRLIRNDKSLKGVDMMKNYENRLKAIKKIADGKTAKIVFLDFKNGRHYLDGKQIDINTIKADVIIIDDIPESEGSDTRNESDG